MPYRFLSIYAFKMYSSIVSATPDSSLVRQCLLETQGLEEDLLVTLRNSILRASGLMGELHLERPSLSYEMFSRKWIEQFFGYAFFDYNV